jgi:hypothetical protein
MSDEPVAPDPALSAIEAALGALVPAQSRIDRDLVMFRAGQGSVRPPRFGRWTSSAIAAGLALVALAEAILLAHRPPPQVVKEFVVVREPVAPPASSIPPFAPSVAELPRQFERSDSLGQTPYERLTAQVLRYGLDGLPASPRVAPPISGLLPASSGQMLQEELRKLVDAGDPS